MWSLERDVPLKACPDMFFRRDKICHGAVSGRHCAITHFLNKDDLYDMLSARIYELRKMGDPDPATRYLEGEAKAAAVYKALLEREAEFGLL